LHILDQFKQDGYSIIEHSLEALNYKIFKENFEFENYLRILEEKDIYSLAMEIQNYQHQITYRNWPVE